MFVLDILDDQLVVFGADALVTIYELKRIDDGKSFFLGFRIYSLYLG